MYVIETTLYALLTVFYQLNTILIHVGGESKETATAKRTSIN